MGRNLVGSPDAAALTALREPPVHTKRGADSQGAGSGEADPSGKAPISLRATARAAEPGESGMLGVR